MELDPPKVIVRPGSNTVIVWPQRAPGLLLLLPPPWSAVSRVQLNSAARPSAEALTRQSFQVSP